MTSGLLSLIFAMAEITSRHNGSCCDPGSFVRSMAAIVLTVLGSAFINSSAGKGRYRRITMTPVLYPRSRLRYSTVSLTTSAPEPIITITRSASGAPK